MAEIFRSDASPAPDRTVDVRTTTGAKAGAATLRGAVFGIEPNVAVMHQVVTAQLAAARRGTHSTKTRGEVRGGGAKPWKQKGTGRARQGSRTAPHWTGGGIAHGPKPRDYSQRTPRKMVRLALLSALSDRASEGKVVVVDGWSFDAPKTKPAIAALAALGITEGRVLLVLGEDDDVAFRSFRNLPNVQIVHARELNTFDVLVNDWLVFTTETLAVANNRVAGVEDAATAAPAPAKTTTAKAAPAPVAAEPADDAAAETDDAAADDAAADDTEGEA
jgi:large subunit ribosomal protein L4